MLYGLCVLTILLSVYRIESGFIGFGDIFSATPSTTVKPVTRGKPPEVLNPFMAFSPATVGGLVLGVFSGERVNPVVPEINHALEKNKEELKPDEISTNETTEIPVKSGNEESSPVTIPALESSTISAPEPILDNGTSTPAESTTGADLPTTKKPHVPVGDEDRRVVAVAPPRACEGDAQRDESGNCRETVRK